jgi:hypothetical protein
MYLQVPLRYPRNTVAELNKQLYPLFKFRTRYQIHPHFASYILSNPTLHDDPVYNSRYKSVRIYLLKGWIAYC